ncbi:MAG: FAD-binding protein [Ruminococcaceae bacterium]|nr:FAD-binding protein [Oscillospiraceae bacterium]
MSTFKTYTHQAIVVGTGAAGFSSAINLKKNGIEDVVIVTEGINMGTSRNTGSDKQTYYKLSLSGDKNDSVRLMCENLFNGGSVDGDNALAEASLSVQAFMNLCDLGVPFPQNAYGEYVGYKTDHDPYERATSAGPLTSKYMTEALEKKANELNIKIYDKCLCAEIITDDEGVIGILAIDKITGEAVLFNSPHIILATGGPSGIYKDSVYPLSHTGSSGLAVRCGAKMQNLTEWQYGLASVNPRWNVSGTYMQCLPRFVSIDSEGKEYEFLSEYFDDVYQALSNVFLKGYQWPFDSSKVLTGSSVIDILCYRETVLKKRRVYLDFTKNPFGLTNIDFEKLTEEGYTYLKNAQATFGTPIERLEKMNAPAIDLYLKKGVDITKEYLEIALSSQHSNGGISVNSYWESSIKGLFAVGECAGTHGVARPGGSALNSGQVSALRVARYISVMPRDILKEDEFIKKATQAYTRHTQLTENILSDIDNVSEYDEKIKRTMSDGAAAIRVEEKLIQLIDETKELINNFEANIKTDKKEKLFKVYKLYDMLYSRLAVVCSMADFIKNVHTSRGSAIYYSKDGSLRDGLEEQFRFIPDDKSSHSKIQEIYFEGTTPIINYRDVRPVPDCDDVFEIVWKGYRENKNVF